MRERLLVVCVAVAAVGARSVNITQPFVDHWSWRQADMAMIAGNLYRDGFDLLHPRIDWAGAEPGYVGTEFPLVPAIAALLYLLLGVQDWIGRAVSIAFFAASVPFLYRLLVRLAGRMAALWAIAVYGAIPVSIFSARSFMSDTASLALALAAVWLFVRWLDDERAWLLAGAGVAAALALLVKLAAVAIAVPLLALALRKHGRRLAARIDLWAVAIAVGVVTAAWYLHGYRIHLLYPPYHFFGQRVLGLTGADTYTSVFQSVVTTGLSPVVGALAVGGLLLSRGRPAAWVLPCWLLGAALFVVPLAGGYHPWYALPFVPPAAGLAGVALDAVQRRLDKIGGRTLGLAATGLLLVAVAVSSWRLVSPLYESRNDAASRAGRALQRLAPPDALVTVVDGGDPTALYYSRRRGWHFPPGHIGALPATSEQAIAELASLKLRGVHSLTLLRHTRWWLDHYPEFARYLTMHGRVAEDTSDYVVFVLTDAER
jgi:4-amino-4-deoxy-L-arabinose transferase-like glycosyltransferase